MDDEQEIKINTIPSRLKDIFVDKKHYNNLGGDEDFINNIYSNDTQKLKNSLNKSKQIRQFRIFLKWKFSDLFIDYKYICFLEE